MFVFLYLFGKVPKFTFCSYLYAFLITKLSIICIKWLSFSLIYDSCGVIEVIHLEYSQQYLHTYSSPYICVLCICVYVSTRPWVCILEQWMEPVNLNVWQKWQMPFCSFSNYNILGFHNEVYIDAQQNLCIHICLWFILP